jgi:ring-1,2-phenylacetyl-CoA epoxidase subunit PaaC
MFDMDETEEEMLKAGIGCDNKKIKLEWDKLVLSTLEEANLKVPENTFFAKGTRNGIHTEHLGFLLAEMQYLPRAYPNANWG